MWNSVNEQISQAMHFDFKHTFKRQLQSPNSDKYFELRDENHRFFVNCVDGFKQQPEIANGVSDLMVEIFGEAGRHARFAIGTNALPRNCATESDAVFEVSSN